MKKLLNSKKLTTIAALSLGLLASILFLVFSIMGHYHNDYRYNIQTVFAISDLATSGVNIALYLGLIVFAVIKGSDKNLLTINTLCPLPFVFSNGITNMVGYIVKRIEHWNDPSHGLVGIVIPLLVVIAVVAITFIPFIKQNDKIEIAITISVIGGFGIYACSIPLHYPLVTILYLLIVIICLFNIYPFYGKDLGSYSSSRSAVISQDEGCDDSEIDESEYYED